MSSSTTPYPPYQPRSGGKIVRPRRTVAPKTPYDRPPLPRLLPDSAPQNPNWLSRLILSPTRMIATGAGKVLSVFRYDSSSSSSSSSDADFTSDADMDDADDDISSQDANKLENGSQHASIPHAIEWKSETKRAIERLLTEETFSREECDRLTYIIKSRVVDSPVTQGIDGRLLEIPGTTAGNDAEQLCSTAITEAKKWLEEKKLGSNSKSELEYATCTLNTVMLPHVTEVEVGSPVDLAKSYMQARPAWASPSMSNIQSLSPSPVRMRLFKEETSYSFGGNSLSASKLIRDSSAIGSWNIQEEIRKVRSRATEEMLRARPSSIIDWATLASDINKSSTSLMAYKAETVSQIAEDGLQNESSPIDLATSIPERSQDLGAAEILDRAEGLQDGLEGKAVHGQRLQLSEDLTTASQNGDNDADGACQHINSTVEGDNQDSRSLEIKHSTMEEVAGRDGAAAANGFPSGSSLYEGEEREQKSKLSEEKHTSVDSDHDKTRNAPVDGTCELLSESYMEVPIVNESDTAATGSQNSSSMQHGGLSQKQSPRTKHRAGKSNDVTVTEKQQVGRQRYVRKGKSRGK